MHFSPVFKSSSTCVVSPDGQWVATATGSSTTTTTTTSISIHLRSTQTLRSANPVKLPPDFSAPVTTLVWAPSSSRLLAVAGQDICAYEVSTAGTSLLATIKNPVPGPGKPSHVQFGHGDGEVIVFSTHGLKVLVFELSTAKAVEVASPKWYHPASAPRACSVRPSTGHLALLTRVGGKDMLSIHDPSSRQLQRSWHPETNDVQGVAWSPDGQWLLMWDAAIHGRRLLLYTPDGHLFRSLDGSDGTADEVMALSQGIRSCRFSPDGELCAICDHSSSVAILRTRSWRRDLALIHPSTVTPGSTVQVWQEQSQGPHPTFVRATHSVTPPASDGGGKTPRDATSGCSSAQFDASSNLLATKLDDAPTTLWIWDLAAAELRAVLIFHSNIECQWHPTIQELLLITRPDETYRGPPFVWDPLSNGPRPVSLQDQTTSGKLVSKTRGAWLNTHDEAPTLLLSDNAHYCLVSVSDDDNHGPPWRENNEYSMNTTVDDTPIRGSFARGYQPGQSLPGGHTGEDDSSLIDDTFSFKRV